MNTEKLTIRELSAYLPWGLKIKILNHTCDYVGIERAEANGFYFIGEELYVTYKGGSTGKSLDTFKPLLHPLSDLLDDSDDPKKDALYQIVNNASMHCDAYDEWLYAYIDNPEPSRIFQAPYEVFDELTQQHYDVFNLIPRGLALPIPNPLA